MPSLESTNLRAKAKEIFHATAKNNLNIVWLLGEIHGSKVYRDWGFKSFGDWYRQEGAASPSLSHAYALARVGRTFMAQRTLVEEKVAKGDLSIRDLMNLTAQQEQGQATAESVIEAVTNPGKITSVGDAAFRDDPERPREIRLHVPQADFPSILSGMIKYGIAEQYGDASECFKGHAIDAHQNLGLEYVLSILRVTNEQDKEIFSKLIEEGNFFCAACHKIPLSPNLHHILPVSIGHGYGPQALLCETCHIQIVQPKHKAWTARWGKRYGFDYKSLKAEAERQIASGEVDTAPTVIIHGYPRNISS